MEMDKGIPITSISLPAVGMQMMAKKTLLHSSVAMITLLTTSISRSDKPLRAPMPRFHMIVPMPKQSGLT